MAGPVADGALTPGAFGREAGDAFVVVDLQRDLLPGGPLAGCLPICCRLLMSGYSVYMPIAVRSWPLAIGIPRHHCSFKAQGGPWPARLRSGLARRYDSRRILNCHPTPTSRRKGPTAIAKLIRRSPTPDLAEWLRDRDVRRLFIAGVATEYCVVETARDGAPSRLRGRAARRRHHGGSTLYGGPACDPLRC
jgi:nicotinamidase/pyrazinamidase